MKKIFGKIVAAVLMVGVLCSNISMVNAAYSTDEVTVNSEMEQTLNGYFDKRESAFYGSNANSEVMMAAEVDDCLLVEREVSNIETLRNEGIREFIDKCEIDVVDVKTTYSIEDCESVNVYQDSKYLNGARYVVYEWTWIDYMADDVTVEGMGLGTWHYITIAFDGNDYVVISDEYDESDVSGVCTLDYSEAMYESESEEIMPMALEHSFDEYGIELLSLDNTEMGFDVNDFIAYADEWVYHSPASSGASYYSYYNPEYYYYTGNDCANYASQCLHAAGMVFDRAGDATWYAETTTNSTPKAGDSSRSTESWRRVGKFEEYWVTNQEYEECTFDASNLTPGCVVINSGKSHIMVCVGYNSSGKPVLNGHTNDRYHMVATGFTGAKYVIRFTYETPDSYTTLSSSTTYKSERVSSINTPIYYKFTPSTTGYYSIYTESAMDTVGCLYEEDTIDNTSYKVMAKVGSNDDDGSGNNFCIEMHLNAGTTYYIEVIPSSVGTYGLCIEH